MGQWDMISFSNPVASTLPCLCPLIQLRPSPLRNEAKHPLQQFSNSYHLSSLQNGALFPSFLPAGWTRV